MLLVFCASILGFAAVGAPTATQPEQPAAVDMLPILNWPVPREWLNVKAGCGSGLVGAAVGDGIADDTAAIQSCFDLVNNETEHFTVYLPAGTYKITETLVLYRVRLGRVVPYLVGVQACHLPAIRKVPPPPPLPPAASFSNSSNTQPSFLPLFNTHTCRGWAS